MVERDPLEEEIGVWMQEFARPDERPRPLPDPATLWVKAKLLQSTMAVERASRPMTVTHIAAYLVVAGGWAALLTWNWNKLAAWFRGLSPAHIILGAAGAETATTLSLTFFLLLVCLASVTVILAFHTILAEE